MPTDIAQITRGVCPARSIAEAKDRAYDLAQLYRCFAGSLPDVKNEAAEWAFGHEHNLLLIEDDIIAPHGMWYEAVMDATGDILFASARTRDGVLNTVRTEDGRLLYTGNCFMRIPYDVLRRLERPCFRAMNFRILDDRLIPTTPNEHGAHSDLFFWWNVSRLDPRPGIREIGTVTHLRHTLNEVRENYGKPCEITEW